MGIYFTAPTFISPEKIRFRYKLEGLDQEWIDLPPGVNPRFAHYVKPPPGQYLFRVIACNSHGIWNKTGDSFEFTIAPYYYQTAWFKIGFPFISLLIVSSTIFFIGKSARKRRQNRKYSHSSLTKENAERCLKQLSVLLDVDKVYHNPDLSLNSLAEQLSVPAPHLSQVINDKMQQSFFDMVNSYRIKEAKQLLKGKKAREKSILDIAFDVGFNSQAAFYRAFSKFAGCSPSEYRKQNLG
jgi:AraC-like DNA-binding protein